MFGSDGPIEPHDPLIGIHAAVTRRRADGTPGPEGWQGQERITVSEAVDAYTYWPAYAAGEESYRGSIAAGKVADLVVLAENIFKIDPMRILKYRVDMTVMDGKVVRTGRELETSDGLRDRRLAVKPPMVRFLPQTHVRLQRVS